MDIVGQGREQENNKHETGTENKLEFLFNWKFDAKQQKCFHFSRYIIVIVVAGICCYYFSFRSFHALVVREKVRERKREREKERERVRERERERWVSSAN